MRTAKSLECSDRRYYLPELSTCPACGGQLVPARHLAWRKVIQTLQTTFFAASRPSFCPKPACRGRAVEFAWQRLGIGRHRRSGALADGEASDAHGNLARVA